MPQRILSLCLALALAFCLLAPGVRAEPPSPEEVKALLAEAEAGDFQAQFELGELYAAGSGVPKNDKKAVDWYRKSAEQGYADAQNELGRMYANGRGVPQDDKKAVAWYRKAAEQGHAEAMFKLGEMYEKGVGVERDDKAAADWRRKAAERGHAKAMHLLAWMYENGEGVERDDEKAADWRRKAAEKGHDEAQYQLGEMYEEGRGLPQDIGAAVVWYRKAAEQGHDWAMRKMAQLCEEGRGVPQNWKEAADWRARLAERIDRASYEYLDEYRTALVDAEQDLYRMRGGLFFRKVEEGWQTDEIVSSADEESPEEDDASADAESPEEGETSADAEMDEEEALFAVDWIPILEAVIDWPVEGDAGETAALRRAIERLIDESLLSRVTENGRREAEAGKAESGDIRDRLKAMSHVPLRLPEELEGAYRLKILLNIEVLHQDRNTVTLKVVDGSWNYGGGPLGHRYRIVRKSDGRFVENGELLVPPKTKPRAPEDDDEDREIVTVEDFVAHALGNDDAPLGVWSGGLLFNKDDSVRMFGALVLDEFATWTDLEPHLTPLGRKLFAEHLPKKGQAAPRPAKGKGR